MVKINALNVAKFLFDEISSKFNASSPVNAKEIELMDQHIGKFTLYKIIYIFLQHYLYYIVAQCKHRWLHNR